MSATTSGAGTTMDARTGATSPTTKADQRRAAGGAKADDGVSAYAYDVGKAGDPYPSELRGNKAARQAYNTGRQETAKAAASGAGASARRVGEKTGGYLSKIGSKVAQGASEGSGSWVGIAVAVIALSGLFILLNNAGLAARVINAITSGLMWVISPAVLPF